MAIVKWAGGALLAIGMTGYAYLSDKQETTAVLSKYDFTEVQLERFNACKGAMKAANVSFDVGSDAGGCGCIVEKIGSQIPENRQLAAHDLDVLNSWASGAEPTEPEYNNRLSKLAAKRSLPLPEIRALRDTVDNIIEKCSS
jgi:hypothetical protein